MFKKNIFNTAIALLLFAACSPAKHSVKQDDNQEKYYSVTPAQHGLIHGKPIQAYGFSVFYKDGTYYRYGGNKEYITIGR